MGILGPMPVKQPKAAGGEVPVGRVGGAAAHLAKRRKVPVKLTLDPILVRDVRARLRDGLSFSAHVSRILREELDRVAAASRGRP